MTETKFQTQFRYSKIDEIDHFDDFINNKIDKIDNFNNFANNKIDEINHLGYISEIENNKINKIVPKIIIFCRNQQNFVNTEEIDFNEKFSFSNISLCVDENFPKFTYFLILFFQN